MKPWFLKEGEVIDFPKKDDKVIELPSVDHYNSFFDGVRDLQVKLEQGDITKTIYDKLYQDLIHRFAKKESAETPWFLREDVTSQTDQTIDQIANIAKDSDPKIQNYVKKVFQKVIDYANKKLNQQQENVNEAPQIASVSTDQMAVFVKSKYDDIIEKFGPAAKDPKIQQFLEKALNDIKAYAEKSGVETGRKELNDFLVKFDNTIDSLTNKITSSEQAFVDANTGAKGKTVQKDVARKKNTIAVIKQVISSIFTGKLFKPGTISDQQLQEKLINFLSAAKDGIVDWGKILEAGRGRKARVESFVPSEYREIFDMFKTQLFRARPPTTAGAWGPGEVGLILLGNPITKAGDGGDLQDSKTGDKFELKGSNNPKKGGRLSPDGLSTDDIRKKFKEVKDKFIGPKILKKLGPKSNLNRTSFNKSFIESYNELVEQGLKINTKRFVMELIKTAFTDNVPTDKELTPYVEKMINGNKINVTGFLRTYAKFLFDRYQGKGKSKSFKNVIVFNPGTTTYTVLDSSKDIDSPDLEVTGGIEFGATQVPKSPQIGIA